MMGPCRLHTISKRERPSPPKRRAQLALSEAGFVAPASLEGHLPDIITTWRNNGEPKKVAQAFYGILTLIVVVNVAVCDLCYHAYKRLANDKSLSNILPECVPRARTASLPHPPSPTAHTSSMLRVLHRTGLGSKTRFWIACAMRRILLSQGLRRVIIF